MPEANGNCYYYLSKPLFDKTYKLPGILNLMVGMSLSSYKLPLDQMAINATNNRRSSIQTCELARDTVKFEKDSDYIMLFSTGSFTIL